MRSPLPFRAFPRSVVLGLLFIAWLTAPSNVMAETLGVPSGSANGFERCRAIKNDAERLRCYEATSAGAGTERPGTAVSAAVSAWRLVRTPNPSGSGEAVSIMRTADFAKSDLDFAGLMIRCSDNTAVEVLFVVIEPFPPRSHPRITLTTGPTPMKFAGTVVPPGLLIRLPAEAAALVDGPWQSATELRVQLQDEQDTVHGAVPLDGLQSALALLRSSCGAP